MNNLCISYKNKKTKDLCNRKCINNTNYCGLHKKKVIDFKIIRKNKILINKVKNKLNLIYKKKYVKLFDKYNHENLMCIYESFNEIYLNNLFFMDNKIWDINLLLDQWTNLLCSTEMQNSSPIFPSNPFTRKNISSHDIKNILNIAKNNKIKLYAPLKYLFMNVDKILVNNYEKFNTDFNLKRKIINLLEEKFRFRLLNIKNSQDSYTGIWIYKEISLSDFEIFFDYYDKIPIQVQNFLGNIIDNNEKIHIKQLLDNYPKDIYDINDLLEEI